MDNKGRVNIPSRYREILQGRKDTQIVLTNLQQRLDKEASPNIRYILAFPYSEWQKVEDRLAEQPIFRNRNVQRFITSGVQECPLDRLGRILIPPDLRDYANLTREVCLVGMTRCFEIWDRAAYEAHAKQLVDTIDEGMLDELLI
jgi:MraZ protein